MSGGPRSESCHDGCFSCQAPAYCRCCVAVTDAAGSALPVRTADCTRQPCWQPAASQLRYPSSSRLTTCCNTWPATGSMLTESFLPQRILQSAYASYPTASCKGLLAWNHQIEPAAGASGWLSGCGRGRGTSQAAATAALQPLGGGGASSSTRGLSWGRAFGSSPVAAAGSQTPESNGQLLRQTSSG
jgi:hypothetical protein